MDLTELYQDLILDHGQKPRNFGKLKLYNHDAKGHNPLCGDNIHLYLNLDKKGIVTDLSFEGSGCAISVASSSIMTEIVKNKSEKKAKELLDAFFKMIKDNNDLKKIDLTENEKIKFQSLSGVNKFPMRVKCATLCWHTLKAAFDNQKQPINSEVID
jgi:nitrogen fixation protein NifU and related proteins